MIALMPQGQKPRQKLALAALLVLAIGSGLALPAAADDIRQEQVVFPAGSTGTRLTGQITGRESISYLLGAEAGQTIDVRLTSASTSVYFNLYQPGSGPGDEALAIGEQTSPEPNHFTGILPASGVYTVSVFLYRNAARDGKSADFALDISITGATGSELQGDFADGLAGGPDVFAVRTSGGGTLNLRAEASAGAAVVTRLAAGTLVRNLGCRMAEGRRWCRVATLADPGFEGWAAGEFLVEGSDPGAAAPKARPATTVTASPEDACRAAIAAQVEPGYAVVVARSEFSQAGTTVTLSVGPCGAPWQCTGYSDGTTDGVMFLGNDGDGACAAAQVAAETGDMPSPEEQACLAAVSRETDNGDLLLLGSDFSQAGTLVQIGVGPDRAPWQCIAYPDGTTGGIEFLGQDGGQSAEAPGAGSPTAAAEAACVAAVAVAANNANIIVLTAVPGATGTRVALAVGTDHSPWTCTVADDGTTRDVAYTGGN